MPSVLPPLDSLRVLAACVRHRSFSRAASELCLTPSAVSLRMRNLEASLGVTLFERHGPRLSVTDQGLLLAAKVGQVTTAAAERFGEACAARVQRRIG